MEYRGHGGRGNGLWAPERGGQQAAREAEGEGAQEKPALAPQEVEDVAARVGAESHPDGGDEEDPAVGGSHDPLAEVLAGEEGGERHDAAPGHPEDQREPVEAGQVAGGEEEQDHERLEAEPGDQYLPGAEAIGQEARPQPAEDG